MDGFTPQGLRSLLAALALSGAGAAQAAPIDFDDLDPAEGSVSEQRYAGFDWDPRWQLGSTDDAFYSDAAASGRQFLRGTGQDGLFIGRDRPFELDSLWLAGPDHRYGATRMRITGYGLGNQPVGDSGWLRTSETPTRVSLKWSGVTRLTLRPFGNYRYTLDSLSYRDRPVAVTEAGSLVLLGIGVLSLWAARRRLHHPDR